MSIFYKKQYSLPQCANTVNKIDDFAAKREEIKKWFSENVYGFASGDAREGFSFEKTAEVDYGYAKRMTFSVSKDGYFVTFYFYKPNGVERSPVLVHPILKSYIGVFNLDDPSDFIKEKSRSSFPIKPILDQGYAVACYQVNDVARDETDGDTSCLMPSFCKERKDDSAGVLKGWALFASVVIDCLLSFGLISETKIGICGHSRGGKTALLCAAYDERFSFACANNSGCSGAALTYGKTGENIRKITERFPFWFCKNYAGYADKDNEMLYDQDALLSLIAPGLVYVTSSSKDKWACPKNEFLSCLSATKIYREYGKIGLLADNPPKINEPYHGGDIGYHIKRGKHSFAYYDWMQMLAFLKKKGW